MNEASCENDINLAYSWAQAATAPIWHITASRNEASQAHKSFSFLLFRSSDLRKVFNVLAHLSFHVDIVDLSHHNMRCEAQQSYCRQRSRVSFSPQFSILVLDFSLAAANKQPNHTNCAIESSWVHETVKSASDLVGLDCNVPACLLWWFKASFWRDFAMQINQTIAQQHESWRLKFCPSSNPPPPTQHDAKVPLFAAFQFSTPGSSPA